jgi:chromosome partitioning protein
MAKSVKISFISNKGGSTRSSSLSSIAGILSNEMNQKVLLGDFDEQSNLKTLFGVRFGEAEGGMGAILNSGVEPLKMTVKVRDNMDLIVSGGRLIRDFERTYGNTPENETILEKRFKSVKDAYDFQLFDTSPSLNLIHTNLAFYSDYLILSCTPDLLGFIGVKSAVAFLETLQKHYPNRKLAKVLGVICGAFDPRRNLDLDVYEDLKRLETNDLLLGGKVFSPIRHDIKVRTAQVKRKTITEAFPNTKASEDYRQVVKEIMLEIEKRETQTTSLKEPKKLNEAVL